jgi:hypothetical protein
MAVLSPHDLVEAMNAQARARDWPTRCDADLAFELAELTELVTVWRERLNGRVMPLRTEIPARALKRNLRRLMLFERVEMPDGHRYRIRLMGTSLVQVWGDLTGKLVNLAVPQQLSPRWEAFLDLVLKAQCPMRFVAEVRSFLVAEIAAVPLADDSGRPVMVMAALHISSDRQWDSIVARFPGEGRP